jgi:MFS family permease
MSYQPLEARTSRLLYIEIFWSAILGAIITFTGAFVLRLGASNTAISLLSALPSLAAIIVALPAGRFLQSRLHPRLWTIFSLGLFWFGYLVLAFVPGVSVFGLTPGGVGVLVIFLFSVPQNFSAIGVPSLMAEVVPEPHRIRVFGMRSLINFVMQSGVTLLAGVWLSRIPFPTNYQSMFVIGWVCSLFSLACLMQFRARARAAPAGSPARLPRRGRSWQLWPADVGRQHNFRQVLINSLLHQTGLWLAGPLFILRYVRELEAADAWLGLHATVTGLSTAAGLIFWRWATERLREPRTLRLTILPLSLFPLIVGLTPSLTPILVFDVINGFFVAGVNLSHGNIMLQSLPDDKRPEYMGLYSTIINAGAFICPVVSVALAGWLGIGPTLVLCAGLTLLGGMTYFVWRVPVSTQSLTVEGEAHG